MLKFFNPAKLNRLLRFKPTLGQLMDLCEENYRLLNRLAPDLAQMRGHYQSTDPRQVDLHLQVLEQSRYTSLIRLTYEFSTDEHGSRTAPDTTLRVYHDSAQLEIIELKDRHLFLKNNYQHPGLYLKWQANVFINKWLTFCLQQQHVFTRNSADDHSHQPTEAVL